MLNGFKLTKRNNGIYQIEYKHPVTNLRIRTSLKVKDEKYAKMLAEKQWKEILDDFDRGILVTSKDLSKILHEYCSVCVNQYNVETIKRHFAKYLDEKKIKVSQIKQRTINEYYKWRENQKFRDKSPSDKTINKENYAINDFLKFCTSNNYLSPKIEIKLIHRKTCTNRRDAFSTDEIIEILEMAKLNYMNTEKRDLKAYRKNLYNIVLFLSMTGMRDGPALKLTWKDTKLFEKLPYIFLKANISKTRKQSLVTLSKEFAEHLKQLKSQQIEFCKKHNIKFSDDFNIFTVLQEYEYQRENGDTGKAFPIKSFISSWRNLIKQCSFYYEGGDFAPYRLRHYKITSLMANKNNISIEQIAKYVSTSPEMIRTFYDNTDTLDFYDEFSSLENFKDFDFLY